MSFLVVQEVYKGLLLNEFFISIKKGTLLLDIDHQKTAVYLTLTRDIIELQLFEPLSSLIVKRSLGRLLTFLYWYLLLK